MPRKSPQRASVGQIVKVHGLPAEHFKITTPATSIALARGSYAEGWDDVRIASEANVALATVRHVRQEEFGQISERATNAASIAATARIAELEQHHGALVTQVAGLITKYDKLLQLLMLNRIIPADNKHLLVNSPALAARPSEKKP